MILLTTDLCADLYNDCSPNNASKKICIYQTDVSDNLVDKSKTSPCIFMLLYKG